MNLQAVCIDGHRGTADGGKVKAAFPFFDEIFHFAATSVKLEHLVWRQFLHCGNNECVSVYNLPARLFYLEDNSAGIAP